ncbi:TadE family protein [Cohnella soli]|uniref:TadE family protein n=1 Tax=Cohnella soli TaxID=425005 RepID=A0ABW0HLX2_9BACL
MTITRGKKEKLGRDEGGSVTLEASAILPWVFLMIALTILFALYVFHRSVVYYGMTVTAERSAYSWSNSAKDTKSGAFEEGKYDGLYWRLTDDALVKGLFGLASGNETVEVDIAEHADGEDTNSGSGAKDKLSKRASDSRLLMDSGEMGYRNVGLKREIRVWKLEEALPGPLKWLRRNEGKKVNVSALVVEPTEFLRTFELIRYYAAKMKDSPEGEADYKEKAGKTLKGKL